MARISFTLPDELEEELNSHLSYGDNRSEWIREAVREKLEREREASEGNLNSPAIAMT